VPGAPVSERRGPVSLDDEAIVNALREARDNATFATEDEFVAFARPTASERCHSR